MKLEGVDMNESELRIACIKFNNYLRANGVMIHAHLIMVDDDRVVGMGNKTKAQMMLVAAVADMMGYKLEPL